MSSPRTLPRIGFALLLAGAYVMAWFGQGQTAVNAFTLLLLPCLLGTRSGRIFVAPASCDRADGERGWATALA